MGINGEKNFVFETRIVHEVFRINETMWRRAIMANLLRCYRIWAWLCTSIHSLRPHPQRLASPKKHLLKATSNFALSLKILAQSK